MDTYDQIKQVLGIEGEGILLILGLHALVQQAHVLGGPDDGLPTEHHKLCLNCGLMQGIARVSETLCLNDQEHVF